MRTQTPEAVAWLVTAGFTSFGLLCFGAFVYEKTRKKVEHPKLGPLTFEWGTWVGSLPSPTDGEPSVRFELPGPRTGPQESLCEEMTILWSQIATLTSEARPSALEEFEEIQDNYESDAIEHIAQAVASDPKSFEKFWTLAGVYRTKSEDGLMAWRLEFEVDWDPEHTRSAHFSQELGFSGYTLSVAEVEDDETE